MNFYCDSGGVIFHVDPERIFQGSAGVNKIRFVGQFPSNAQVLVSYKLPNGIWTVPKYMTFVSALEEVQAPNGGIFSVWESLLGATPKVDSSGAPVLVDGVQQYELDYTITQNAGTVDVQFFVYAPAEQSNVQNGARLATEISSITVEKGVPVVVPEYSETDDYEVLLQQILNALTGIVSEYQDVEQRLTTAENNIGVLQEDTANLRTELDELTDTVDNLDADLTTAEENIETLQNDVNVVENDIVQLKTSVAIVQIKANNLQNEVDGLQDDVSGITTDVQNIREALDLAEITETVEVTDKYNFRQTANGLTLYPGQPTTLLKVEGDTIATINKFNASAISNSNITVADEGRTITLVTGAGASPSNYGIGKLQDLCPTLHIGDTVYLYGTGAINGLCNSLFNNLLPFNSSTPTVLTDEILNTDLFINCGVITSSTTITDLQITKLQNATWTPYFEGLKSAEFAGVEITGKNLFNPNRTNYPNDTWLSPDMPRDLSNPYLFRGMSASGYYSVGNVSMQYENGVLEFTTTGGGYGVGFNIPCAPKQKYAISFKTLGDTMPSKNVGFYKNGVCIGYQVNVAETITAPTPQDCDQLMVVFANNVAGTFKITDIQIQIGTNATAYVPYTDPSVFAFPNTVNPLGQTIDFEQKKIVNKYTQLIELDGTENWSFYAAIQSNGVLLSGYSNLEGATGICTDANVVTGNIPNSIRFYVGALIWFGVLTMLGIAGSAVITDAAEQASAVASFKAYLANRKANGNPVTILAMLNTTTETQFTVGQIAAGDSYLPYTGGTETVDNANAEYGVENTVTQEYDIVNKIGG